MGRDAPVTGGPVRLAVAMGSDNAAGAMDRSYRPGRWRRATAVLRSLPDFLIIGTMKGGTTSLFEMLASHPGVRAPAVKEVHYFDVPPRGERSLWWYRACFPVRGRGITGEASPYYMYRPGAIERIAKTLPRARLIALLRDPVARAYSHYRHAVRKGWESRGVEEAFDDELGQLGEAGAQVERDPARDLPIHQQRSYIHRGQYAEQIERLWRHVARERTLVLQSEAMFRDGAAVGRRVQAFLGLAQRGLTLARVPNRGGYAEAMPYALSRRLARHFAPHNERLFEMLGERYDWAG